MTTEYSVTDKDNLLNESSSKEYCMIIEDNLRGPRLGQSSQKCRKISKRYTQLKMLIYIDYLYVFLFRFIKICLENN